MTLLIFLHGKGGNKDSQADFVSDLALKYGAELLSINAPYKSTIKKDGFYWFEKDEIDGKRVVRMMEWYCSVTMALSAVVTMMREKGVEAKDVILCGHSQGGLIALYCGLKLGVKEVITFNSDIPDEVLEDIEDNTQVKIKWVQGAKDDFLDEKRKESYKNLPKNLDFEYIISLNSTHNLLDKEILDLL